MNALLTQRQIEHEVETLIGKSGHFVDLDVGDIDVEPTHVRCKGIPSGVALSPDLLAMSLGEFSVRVLQPWLHRMGRLKQLRADLIVLGVVHD